MVAMKRIVLAMLSALLVLSTLATQQTPAAAADNAVVVENQQAGSTAWQINTRPICGPSGNGYMSFWMPLVNGNSPGSSFIADGRQ